MNVLLFKLGAIGDVVMSTPFVRQLKKWLGSDSKVTYMVGSRSSEVLVWNPYIDEIITFEEWIFPNKDLVWFGKLLLQLRKLSKFYDTIVLLDKHIALNFTWLLGWFKKRIWFDRMWKEWRFLTDKVFWNASKREVEYYLEFLSFFSITPDYDDQRYDVFWQIFYKWDNDLTDKDISLLTHKVKSKDSIDKLIIQLKSQWKKIIWISTGWWNKFSPKWDCRWWNLDNWTQLANKLIDEGNIVVLLWKWDRELSIESDRYYNLLWKYSFHETLYFISKLDFVICQESGFAHFVGCTNTPMIAIAWPTNPYRFYPHITAIKPHPSWWLWKMEKECYDVYGWYWNCKWNEIDQVTVADVIEKFNCVI